jgi:hypothetical protein
MVTPLDGEFKRGEAPLLRKKLSPSLVREGD